MNLLERDDLQEYLSGCIRVERADDHLLFHRHTERQIEYYRRMNESWWVRSRCPAGIRIELVTDAMTLDLTGRLLRGSRQYAGIDVEVDGHVTGRIRIDTSEDSRTFRLAEFSTQERRQITITLPQSALLEAESLELAEETQVNPITNARVPYLALGDSITQGMDASSPESAYPLQLAKIRDMNLLNLGVGGHVFDPDALDDELPFAPKLITVAYGTNDWARGTTREQVSETVAEYLNRLNGTVGVGARLLVITPIWRAIGEEIKEGGDLVAFSEAIAQAAGSITGVTVVDGLSMVPHRDSLFVDGTHPTDEGFLHYAINLNRAFD
ncbi:MAG TPA: hypothetical protein DHW45_16285 [Candidatus Latescibacteria bacterium]|nr:hypothetical protein [Candidatus Latescibacterota bacterium]